MSKFTFTYEDRTGSQKVTFEVNGHTDLSELLDRIQAFLAASGYYFDNSDRLEIVNDDDGYNGLKKEDFDNLNDDFEDYQPNYTGGRYNFTDEQVTEEIVKLKESNPMLSEEAYEMMAWQNLSDRLDQESNHAS